jgi:hypothetical protein
MVSSPAIAVAGDDDQKPATLSMVVVSSER